MGKINAVVVLSLSNNIKFAVCYIMDCTIFLKIADFFSTS